jgi:hypothetical protein
MTMPAALASPELSALCARVRHGDPITIEGWTLVPLLADDAAVEAETLEQALRLGHTQIGEVSEGGSVNRVEVKHRGPGLLLLIDGEEVIGAKQNRVFNASFLVPPGASAVLPVSCVERQRWSYTSREFRASRTTLTGSARRSKLSRVTTSVVAGRSYDADQRAVWDDVDSFLEQTGVSSATSAFSEGFSRRAPAVEERIRRMPILPGQIGLAAVRGSVLVGLDLFATTALYEQGWKKVARGVLADPDDAAAPPSDPVDVVRRALAETSSVRLVRQSAPGCGETLHGSSSAFVMGAVVHRGHAYHAYVASRT